MSRSFALPLLISLLFTAGASCSTEPGEEELGEGLTYDEQHPDQDFNPKADQVRQYEVPDWVRETELVAPEIRVSLDGLSVHLFDRETGLSRVYPTGPGALGQSSGLSVTPTGFFATSPDASSSWWNISERFAPDYFGGFPFLRLTAHNSRGENTYGIHGPITYSCTIEVDGPCPLYAREWFLVQNYVSHGCMRMRAQDIVELFYLIRGHASVPVTIQREMEIDPQGEVIFASEAMDWPIEFAEESETVYGELGARPVDWDPCLMPDQWEHRAYGC